MAGATKRRRSYERTMRKRVKRSVSYRLSKAFPVPEIRLNLATYTHLLTFSSPPIVSEVWQQIRPRLLNIPAGRLTELAGMFDLYKINKFKVTIIPRFTSFDAGTDIANPVPTFTVNNDNYNVLGATGAYNVTTYNAFLERSQAPRHVLGNKIMTFYSKPCTMVDSASSEVKPFPWISTTKTDVFALGLDFFIHCPNFASFKNTTEYDVVVEMDVSFKGNR